MVGKRREISLGKECDEEFRQIEEREYIQNLQLKAAKRFFALAPHFMGTVPDKASRSF